MLMLHMTTENISAEIIFRIAPDAVEMVAVVLNVGDFY